MKNNPTPLEYDECKLFAVWLRARGLTFSHIPNSTWTPSFGAMQRNKALGVDAGIPDYIVLTPNGVLFVEMKRREGSTVSARQKEWIEHINETPGAQAEVCYGYQEAIEFVEKFI